MKYYVSPAPDINLSSHHAILTADVAKVLRTLKKRRAIDKADITTLRDGAEFLTGIMNGSQFVESAGASGLLHSNSAEDIFAFGHALAVIQELNLADGTEVTPFLDELRNQLTSLAERPNVLPEVDALGAMENFFNLLNQMFYNDVAKSTYPPQMRRAGRALEFAAQ